VYFTLLSFESQVDNGGVYQFLFNQPELSILALDAMRIVHLDTLSNDYEVVLNELFGKSETIDQLRGKFQDGKEDWKNRWNSFVKGYKELPSAKVIEDYFYNPDFVKSFHAKIIEYLKENRKNLYKVEE
jgi:hypothetical protein